MRVAHVLRKYALDQWGGTETYLLEMCSELRKDSVDSVIYFPERKKHTTKDPFREKGFELHPFHAFLPIAGLSQREKQEQIDLGGNIFSFDLLWKLYREAEINLIHSHALNRIGASALTVARLRKVPFVVTIHGYLGASSLWNERKKKGWDWGKMFGALLGSRRLIPRADAVVTVNQEQANRLKELYPEKEIAVIPGGVSIKLFEQDRSKECFEAFPQLKNRPFFLVPCRLDRSKNQRFILENLPKLIEKHKDLTVVFAGSVTDETYARQLRQQVEELSLKDHVVWMNGMSHDDPRLIGLYQNCQSVLLPSLIEPFGLVVLEAWAARTSIIASRTEGPLGLIQPEVDGYLFDVSNPKSFREEVEKVLGGGLEREKVIAEGYKKVLGEHTFKIRAKQLLTLYERIQ
ncbi:MAG: glycosyltransferase family 4 protein [Chlamydiales bacterium]